MAAIGTVDWVDLAMGLTGGLALFLMGMSQVTVSLKVVAGDRLRSLLARLSSNRVMGAATGALTTAIIQSSSVTTVLTVGFVSASLLTVTQAASVIIGANLGTTVTAQVIALDVTEYALGLLAAGAATAVVAGRRRRQALSELGKAIAALGFVFLGLDIISDSMAPLGSYQPFLDLLAKNQSPLLALIMGAVFTGLVQSSSATTGIVIVMGAGGLLDFETGIAILLGANIGTAATALLAAIGKSRDALRAGVAHVVVNVAGALAWVGFIGTLADVANWIGGEPVGGVASPQQFANAHTAFNLINTFVFLILLKPLVLATDKLVPAGFGSKPVAAAHAAFLDRDVLATPVIALEVTRRELLRLGLRVRSMLVTSVPAATGGKRQELSGIEDLGREVDALHGHVVVYLRELSTRNLSRAQRAELLRLLRINNELKQMADGIIHSFVHAGRRRLDEMVDISTDTRHRIVELQRIVIGTFDDALEALGTGDPDAAARVAWSKADFYDSEGLANDHLARRLATAMPQRVAAYSIEVSMVEGLRGVHQSCRRIARPSQPPAAGDARTELK